MRRTIFFRNCFFVLLLQTIGCTAFAQSAGIDELKANIANATTDAQRLTATLAFCDKWDSYSPDTLKKYALSAQALALSQKNTKAILLANYYNAAFLYQNNKLDTALKLSQNTFEEYSKNFNYDSVYIMLYRQQCNIMLRTQQYDSALSKDLELMKLAEKNKDTLGMTVATIGLGNVSNKLQKKEEALHWYYQALQLMNNDLFKRKLSFLYNNIAIVHYKLSNEDSMFFFIKKGLQYSAESGNLTDYANALFLYGGMLAEFNKPAEAETAFKQGVEVRKKIGDIYYVMNDMAQFALFYLNTNQPQKGIALCLEGLELASKNSFPPSYDLYESLSRNYTLAGDYKNAEETLRKMIIIKDSVYTKNSAEQLAEMQTKYEVQKKETTIIQQQYDLTKKNYFIYSIVGLLAATLLFGYFFFQNRKKNQQLKIQAIKTEQKKKTTQAVMEAEEEERKRIAGDLHDSVAQKMVVAKLNLEALGNQLNQLNDPQQKIYNNISTLLEESNTEVRNLSHSMMPRAFTHSGFTNAVKEFLDKIEKPGLKINFSADGDFTGIKENKALMIYRIIQECVQNVLKHAKASNLDVAMIAANNEVDITIEDNGTGFNKNAVDTQSTGLKNIRSRIEYLSGKLDINSSPGNGTVIAFYIPLQQA